MSPQYPYPVLIERINGKDLTIVGVTHTPEFYIEHRPFFEGIVKEHDTLVLEQSIIGQSDISFTRSPFFSNFGDLARAQNKSIYQVDPLTYIAITADLALTLLGSLTIASGLTSPKKDQGVSRRDFLKRAGKIGLGLSLLGGSIMGISLTEAIAGEDVIIKYDYGWDDVLLYGLNYYRNIIIAQGLERLCYELPTAQRIAAVHGRAHSKPIHTYLKSPKLRMQRGAYLPYDFLGETRIREYSPTASGWELTRTF